MPAAEEVAAAAPETGQTDLFLAARAPVCESNRPGRFLGGLLGVRNIGFGVDSGRSFRPFGLLQWKFRDRFQKSWRRRRRRSGRRRRRRRWGFKDLAICLIFLNFPAFLCHLEIEEKINKTKKSFFFFLRKPTNQPEKKRNSKMGLELSMKETQEIHRILHKRKNKGRIFWGIGCRKGTGNQLKSLKPRKKDGIPKKPEMGILSRGLKSKSLWES